MGIWVTLFCRVAEKVYFCGITENNDKNGTEDN